MDSFPESEGCFTSEGFIPHKRIRLSNGHTLRAPVAVRVEQVAFNKAMQQRPIRNHGGDLVYVLPGGGVIT